jgi:hypothetical protein
MKPFILIDILQHYEHLLEGKVQKTGNIFPSFVFKLKA